MHYPNINFAIGLTTASISEKVIDDKNMMNIDFKMDCVTLRDDGSSNFLIISIMLLTELIA